MTPISLTVHPDTECSNDRSVGWNEPPLPSGPTFYLEHCCQLLQVHWPFFLQTLQSNWGWEFSTLCAISFNTALLSIQALSPRYQSSTSQASTWDHSQVWICQSNQEVWFHQFHICSSRGCRLPLDLFSAFSLTPPSYTSTCNPCSRFLTTWEPSARSILQVLII